MAHSTTRYPKAAIVANTRGQLAVLPLSLQTTTHSAPPTNKAANNTLPSGNWLIYVSMLPHFCYMKDGPARQRGHHNHTGCIARAINRHHQLIRKTDLNLSSSPKTAPIANQTGFLPQYPCALPHPSRPRSFEINSMASACIKAAILYAMQWLHYAI